MSAADVLALKLTDRQQAELLALAADPDANVGSCTNATMNALEKRGLTECTGSTPPGRSYRKEKWIVTDHGRRWADAKNAQRAAWRAEFNAAAGL